MSTLAWLLTVQDFIKSLSLSRGNSFQICWLMVSKLYSLTWKRNKAQKHHLPPIKPSQYPVSPCTSPSPPLYTAHVYGLTCTAAAPPRSPARPGSPSACPPPSLAIISTLESPCLHFCTGVQRAQLQKIPIPEWPFKPLVSLNMQRRASYPKITIQLN